MSDESRDAFFASLKKMNDHLAKCTKSAEFLKGVTMGSDPITWSLIDRCREALMGVRQCLHVFHTLHGQFSESPVADDANRLQLAEMLKQIDAIGAEGEAAMNTILSWVPPAVNSRSSAPPSR